MPEGIVLVSGRGGSKDAAYAFASDMHESSPGGDLSAPPCPLSLGHGWAFWDRIGRPRHVCAPMVEQSELAFRQLCRRYGTTLAYTPMFHARLFLEDKQYRSEMFDIDADGSAMAKAQGVDTPTDEAGVRKTPAGILAADPVCLSSLLKTGFTVLVD